MDIFAGFNGWCSGFGGYGSHGGFASWMPFHFGGLINMLLLGIVIYFIVKLFRKNQEPAYESVSPHTLLDARYAKGEIDKDTYERMKKDIS